jgi:hypothetical protein
MIAGMLAYSAGVRVGATPALSVWMAMISLNLSGSH